MININSLTTFTIIPIHIISMRFWIQKKLVNLFVVYSLSLMFLTIIYTCNA